LEFLAYHPKDRFRFHHLSVRQQDTLLAVVPGGLAGEAGRPVFTSPLGASTGGPALRAGLGIERVLAVVDALQAHARGQGWGGIEFTIPPAAYAPEFGEAMSFALFCRGFVLKHRWLCPMLPVEPGAGDRYERLFRTRAIGPVRAARRAGVTVEEHGREGLPAFLQVFNDTYTRHGSAATHTPAEIEDLLTRLPDRVRLFIAMRDGTPIGGLMAMLLSSRIAYTFYICSSTEHIKAHGVHAALATLLDWLGDRNYSWLDLGPGAWDGNFNSGVMFFKEGLGAVAHSRDRWIWHSAS
jgi:hypothetical protein